MDCACVTIVVPIYNVEKYLDRCVSSLVNQTYSNLEIILVDDGSPDNCPAMCDAWAKKDNRIKVIHKKNAGLGMARNSGIEAATGSYLCFVDSDDYIDLSTVEKALFCAQEQEAQIVVFGRTRINSRGVPEKELAPVTALPCYRGADVKTVFLPDLVDPEHRDARCRNLCLSAWSAMYSMELVRRTNWRFVSEREMISEDSFSLIWLYSFVECVAVVPEALYFYCENQRSLSQTYRKDRFEKIKSFHNACTEMALRMGHNRELCIRICGLYLAFTIAAMKQVAAAELPRKEKRKILAGIMEDDLTRKILADPDCQYRSRLRKIMFWAMRRNWQGIVLLLLELQNVKDGKH